MIASLHDENNHITIPGFYDKVEELSADERAEMAKAPFEIEEYKKSVQEELNDAILDSKLSYIKRIIHYDTENTNMSVTKSVKSKKSKFDRGQI